MDTETPSLGVMDEVQLPPSPPSEQEKLDDILSRMFPNHGPATICVLKEKTEKGQEVFVCKLSIAGEEFKCHGMYESEQVAMESVASSAVSFLETYSARKAEIMSSFQGTHFEEGISRIFSSTTSMTSTQGTESDYLSFNEEPKNELSSAPPLIKPLDVGGQITNESSSRTSCITILTQYIQKIHPDIRFEPEFSTQNSFFGCRFQYLDTEFVVPAIHSTKQDAREALARQICERVMPACVPPPQVPTAVAPKPMATSTIPCASGDFISWVNVYLQKNNHLAQLAYENTQDGGQWRSKVVFNDVTFVSTGAYPKTAPAKADVAKQIHDYIKEMIAKGEVIAKGGVSERPKAEILQPARASPQIPSPTGTPVYPYMRPPMPQVPAAQMGYQMGYYGMPIAPQPSYPHTAAVPGVQQMPYGAHPQNSIPGYHPQASQHQMYPPNLPAMMPDDHSYGAQRNSLQQHQQHQHQQQQMAAFYYQQQYMYQMRLQQQQQMMYNQQMSQYSPNNYMQTPYPPAHPSDPLEHQPSHSPPDAGNADSNVQYLPGLTNMQHSPPPPF